MTLKKPIILLLTSLVLPVLLSAQQANLVVSGSGDVVGENITHPNGNVYNQVLLTGESVTLRTDGTEITRVSFLDTNEDIVQVEFSGNAEVTVTLDSNTFVDAAPPCEIQPADGVIC